MNSQFCTLLISTVSPSHRRSRLSTGAATNAYDVLNRLSVSWTPAKGQTAYGYDAVGNLTNINYASSVDTSLAYDALNRVTNRVDAAGVTRYAYNRCGALQSEDGPWENDTVSYSYHLLAGASLEQPSAPPLALGLGYDGGDRLTNVTSLAGAFGYAWGGANGASGPGGLIQRVTLPNGAVVTNGYDGLGRLLATRLNGGSLLDAHDYAYNLAHQVTNQVRVDGSWVAYTYDDVGRLRTATGRESGGTTRLNEKLGWDYDTAGNLAFRTNNALVEGFAADGLNRLTQVSRGGTLTVAGTTGSGASSVTVNGLTASLYGDGTFAKDGFVPVDGTNTFAAAAADALGRQDTNTVSVSLPALVNCQYDLNGNLTSDGRRGFEYDDANQLTRVTVTNLWKSEFVYDSVGRRRVSREYVWQGGAWGAATETRYVYDGRLVLQERDASNLPQVAYTWGPDLGGAPGSAGGVGGLLAMSRQTSTTPEHFYYHSDGRGNVTCLLNGSRAVVARYLYDPYGNILSMSGAMAETNRYRYASKEAHARSGLIYFGSRYYDPGFQRWVNADPLGENGGVNLYAYVGNDPVGGFDAWGLEGELPSQVKKPKKMEKVVVTGRNIDNWNMPESWIIEMDQGQMAEFMSRLAQWSSKRDGSEVDKGPLTYGDYAINPEGKETWNTLKREAPVFVLVAAGNIVLMIASDGTVQEVTAAAKGVGAAAAKAAAKTGLWGKLTGFVAKLFGKRAAEEGIVYLRTGSNGSEYVGQAANAARYAERQLEHAAAHPTESFIFQELERVPTGSQRSLSLAEEDWILAGGGPQSTGGRLQNARHQMNDADYRRAGGKIPYP